MAIHSNFQGRLGSDPKTVSDGNTLVFNVAVDNYDKAKTTTWVSCFISSDNKFVFDKAQKYLKKGSGLYVQGRINLHTYTNNEGKDITNLQCNITDFDFALSSGRKDDSQQSNTNAYAAANAKTDNEMFDAMLKNQASAAAEKTPKAEETSENLPF